MFTVLMLQKVFAQPLPTPTPFALPTPGSSHGTPILSRLLLHSLLLLSGRLDGWTVDGTMVPRAAAPGAGNHCTADPAPVGANLLGEPPPRLLVAIICLGSGRGLLGTALGQTCRHCSWWGGGGEGDPVHHRSAQGHSEEGWAMVLDGP